MCVIGIINKDFRRNKTLFKNVWVYMCVCKRIFKKNKILYKRKKKKGKGYFTRTIIISKEV